MSRTHPPTNEPNYQPCNTNFVKRLGCRPSPINEKTLSGKVWQATAKNFIIKLFLLSGHLATFLIATINSLLITPLALVLAKIKVAETEVE